MKQLDWNAVKVRAAGMSVDALRWSIEDCRQAAQAADLLEAAGYRISKSSGYYRDELSVYATELASRQTVTA